MAAHAAALIFGAWWLVATSSVPGPARDCFTGIGNPTRLEVTLGERRPWAAAARCAEIDGVRPGATLVFDLSQGPRPQETSACYDYDTDALSGVDGLTLTGATPTVDVSTPSLTSPTGTWESPQLQDCTGNWSMLLYPSQWINEPVSPLDAGSDQEWVLRRQIRVNRPLGCGGAFTEPGTFTCVDEFVVTSINQLAAAQ